MKITLRILCLEDDHEDYELIIRTLHRGGFDPVSKRVDTREEFVSALTSFKPEVILSDHSLPGFDSTEALVISKASNPRIPFVLVTGAVSDEFAVKALKAGAADYVLKRNLAKLPSVIQNVLKQQESELARRKAALELARRNEELSKINKELDSFVYSVSHNLRAPLMSVLGLLGLAKQEKDESILARYHQMMENSILKLDATLKDILEYSRNARQHVKIGRIDFTEIVEENFSKMQFMPGFEAIEKLIDIDSGAEFFSDSYRLSVIFNNLISNSVKYADRTKAKSHIKIAIVVTSEDATISFSDNGIGINKDLQPKVFDMFFRATQTKEGAGLGLYIVREAVEMLGGEIKIESTFGTGTCFIIKVPNQIKVGKVRAHDPDSMLVDRE